MPSVQVEDLKDVIALEGLPTEHIQWLIDHSEYHEYVDGEIIAKYGDPARHVTVLLKKS